jgi:non-homologous end joining protein Ku
VRGFVIGPFASQLATSGKVGVAQFVLRNRESLCVLKAQGNALTLNTRLWTSFACRSTKSRPRTKSISP